MSVVKKNVSFFVLNRIQSFKKKKKEKEKDPTMGSRYTMGPLGWKLKTAIFSGFSRHKTTAAAKVTRLLAEWAQAASTASVLLHSR